MDYLKKAIGQKIQKRRRELRLSQEALADKISPDTDRSRISEWERGQSLPTKSVRAKLIEALKTDESLFDVSVAAGNPTPDTKDALIGRIVTLLNGLDESQLGDILTTVSNLSRVPAALDAATATTDVSGKVIVGDKKKTD